VTPVSVVQILMWVLVRRVHALLPKAMLTLKNPSLGLRDVTLRGVRT
jgi:hypothetical protein